MALAVQYDDMASDASVVRVATKITTSSEQTELFPIPFMQKPGVGYGKPIPKPQPTVAAKKEQVRRPGYVVATAYSSTVDQTDSSPCTTANGYNVCKHNQENVIAANFLPFGTRVTFPEMYGDRIFVVQDRMHPRFSNRVDFWMKTRQSAKQFGVRRLKMEVVPKQLAAVAIQ